jgi:hypothetical protein
MAKRVRRLLTLGVLVAAVLAFRNKKLAEDEARLTAR